jgi:hypothetical protein
MSEETKAEKFIRLKEARLGRVLDAIRILGNISNTRDYEYTEEQAEEVVDSLYERVDEVAVGFGIDPRTKAVPQEEAVQEEAPAPAKAPVVASKGDPDPDGPKSNITSVDGASLKVAPGAWDNLDLMRAGPNLGLAMEAVMDGDNEKALALLKKVMVA